LPRFWAKLPHFCSRVRRDRRRASPFAAIEDLCVALRQGGYHITVETAATIFKPLACDLASLSPKLASSTPTEREGGRFAEHHNRLRIQPDVIRLSWITTNTNSSS